jgi:hypothetical protein
MAEYRPDLPAGMQFQPGESIDTSSPLYVAFSADAAKRGMSQEQFSRHLGDYVKASRPSAPSPAAPAAPPPPKLDYSKMSTREKIAAALSRSPGRTPLP